MWGVLIMVGLVGAGIILGAVAYFSNAPARGSLQRDSSERQVVLTDTIKQLRQLTADVQSTTAKQSEQILEMCHALSDTGVSK